MFDVDLVDKSVPIPVDVVWDRIQEDVFDEIYFEMIHDGWLINQNNEELKIFKLFKCKVDGEDLVTRVNLHVFKNEITGYPEVPYVLFESYFAHWDTNNSEPRATAREMKRVLGDKFQLMDGYYQFPCFSCTSDNLDNTINIIREFFRVFSKKDISNIIQKQINTYTPKNHVVPGIIIDQAIMKKVIAKLGKKI